MSVQDITSAILRFRDLNVPEGQTIDRHQEIIGNQKSVWWGWWAQGNEQVPTEAFKRLLRLAKNGVDLHLFNSGSSTIRTATCTDIVWDRTGEPILTPGRAATPAYYVDRSCRAWFQFTSIGGESASDRDVRAFSYVDVPDAFVDRSINYGPFADKRIASLRELHDQRRTVWFVRPYKESDPVHEILLVGQDIVAPRDFGESFVESESTRLLWLSDLHFNVGTHHSFPLRPSGYGDRLPLADALHRETIREPAGSSFAGLLISGDLTWRAAPKEFTLASNAIRQISAWAGLGGSQQRIAVAPGNHDIRFSKAPEKPDAVVTVAPRNAKRAFAGFYREMFSRPPNTYLSSGRRYLLGRSIPVEIAVLNSSMLNQIPETNVNPQGKSQRFQGQGFVGDQQLSDAAQSLRWNGPPSGPTIRIVMLHHHLIPVSYSEPAVLGGNYSVILDSGRLSDWIVANRVDLVLHGHQHEPFMARLSRRIDDQDEHSRWHTFHVIGMGSTGVAVDSRPPDVPNMYATLDFKDSAMSVEFRSIDQTLRSKTIWKATLDLSRP